MGLYTVGLFTDRVDDIRHVDGLAGIFHCEPERRQCLRGMGSKDVRETFQDGPLVLDVGNTNVCHLKLVVLHPQAGEVFSDIAPSWAVHIKKSLMQIHLVVHALRGKEGGDGGPLLHC